MTLYWTDRAGTRIDDVIQWARLFEDPGYRFVALDVDGEIGPGSWVSTIWRGITDNLGMPGQYRTAYFRAGQLLDEFGWPDEATALVGHDVTCLQLLGRPARPEDGHLQRAIDSYRRGPA